MRDSLLTDWLLFFCCSFSFPVGCSHQRAWEYFVESIRQPLAFPSERCEASENIGNCRMSNGRAFMGYGADPRWEGDRERETERDRNSLSFLHRLRGKFYLETNDAKPFGRHVSSTSAFIPQPPIPYKMPAKYVNVNVAQDEHEDEDENNTLSNNIENIALTWQNVPKQSGGSSCHFSLLPTL